ncbi:Protein FAM200A [Eumeta japonica]|uniref:Protein FAM200A n=1 Tax=Eumeta variegata TaxID=151549 RepID=A0A4C2A825_EUMVA|nr:Protein FAM200A [Eumeta japonica]
MSIRQQKLFKKEKVGFVNFGNGPQEEKASQVLALILASLTENWKIPIGYFLTPGIKAQTKTSFENNAPNLTDCSILKEESEDPKTSENTKSRYQPYATTSRKRKYGEDDFENKILEILKAEENRHDSEVNFSIMSNNRQPHKCPIFGTIEDIKENVLPTYQDVMKCYEWNKLQVKIKNVSNKEPAFSEIVTRKVGVWQKASIPIVSHTRVIQLLKAYHSKCKNIIKSLKMLATEKKTEFLQQSEILFDICSCKCKIISQCNCPREAKVPKKEHDFYQQVSDRAGAAIASAVLHELSSDIVIDKSKLRRERRKTRDTLMKNQAPLNLPALYFDGRKDKTLKIVKKGTKRYKQVVIEEHVSVIKEPESIYVGYVTPLQGTAKVIEISINALLSAKSTVDLLAIGCDGTVTNTGKFNGVIRLFERRLQRPLQWIICMLHLNELPLRHLFDYLDGKTSGPSTYNGPIGVPKVCAAAPWCAVESEEGRQNVFTQQALVPNNALLASFQVAYRVAKCKKPHTIAEELILPAALDMVNIMVEQSAGKLISTVPLSNNTINQRNHGIVEDFNYQLIEKIKKGEDFGMQLDEATDSNKDAHLICYVRFLFYNIVVEELLFCKSITESEKAQDLFEILDKFLTENGLD